MTKPNIVALQKARLTVAKTLQTLSTETTALEKELKSHANPQWTSGVKTLRALLKDANGKLVNALDKALNEHDEKKRETLYESAWKASSALLTEVKKNKVLAQIEHNPIHPVPAVSAFSKSLETLNNTLR